MAMEDVLDLYAEPYDPKPEIHRRETRAAVRGGVRDRGSGWRGPDEDEMDDVERGGHARGMLTARNRGAGSEFRHQVAGGGRPEPSLAGCARQLGNLVDRSNAEGAVKKGVAGHAALPELC